MALVNRVSVQLIPPDLIVESWRRVASPPISEVTSTIRYLNLYYVCYNRHSYNIRKLINVDEGEDVPSVSYLCERHAPNTRTCVSEIIMATPSENKRRKNSVNLCF